MIETNINLELVTGFTPPETLHLTQNDEGETANLRLKLRGEDYLFPDDYIVKSEVIGTNAAKEPFTVSTVTHVKRATLLDTAHTYIPLKIPSAMTKKAGRFPVHVKLTRLNWNDQEGFEPFTLHSAPLIVDVMSDHYTTKKMYRIVQGEDVIVPLHLYFNGEEINASTRSMLDSIEVKIGAKDPIILDPQTAWMDAISAVALHLTESFTLSLPLGEIPMQCRVRFTGGNIIPTIITTLEVLDLLSESALSASIGDAVV